MDSEEKNYFFFADTNSIMGRRISSFIPARSIISSGGCGSMTCWSVNPFFSSVSRYVVSVL